MYLQRCGRADIQRIDVGFSECLGESFVVVEKQWVKASYLVAVHHEVVGGDKGFEDHHPAGVGRALEQRVCQLRDAHVHLIGAVDQIVEVFLLGPADFVCCSLAHRFADGRAGHAVLGCCDPISDGLPRHLFFFSPIG